MELMAFGKEILHTLAEHAVSYRTGQAVLRQLDKVLWVVEKTARWAVPPPLDQDDRPQPELVRPLPWVFFLALLATLRVTRESVSLLHLLMGKPPLRSADVVIYIQTKRRYLRTLKYQGNRMMRARSASSQESRWASIQSLLQFTMCFRRQAVNNNSSRQSNNEQVLVVKRSNRAASAGAVSGEATMERLIEKMMVDMNADSEDDSSYTLTNATSIKTDSEYESEQDTISGNVSDTTLSVRVTSTPEKQPSMLATSTPAKQDRNTALTDHSAEKQGDTPEKQSGAPEKQSGAPKKQRGAPEKQSGACEKQSGACEKQRGAPEKQSGASEKQSGECEKQSGAPEKQSGAPEKQSGVSEKQSGAPEKQSGAPEKQSGVSQKQSGAPEKQSGAPEKQSGAPEKQSGAPEKQSGVSEKQSGAPEKLGDISGKLSLTPEKQLRNNTQKNGDTHPTTPEKTNRVETSTEKKPIEVKDANLIPNSVSRNDNHTSDVTKAETKENCEDKLLSQKQVKHPSPKEEAKNFLQGEKCKPPSPKNKKIANGRGLETSLNKKKDNARH